MKKFLSVIITLFMLMSLPLCAAATDLSDGTYEVPVVLMHKEDDKESFGNKYVAQTALLEIEKGKRTVTILLTTDMKGIEFSYYINGSLEGDVAKGQPVSDVKIAGETYKQGFEIPVMADGDIGLQFSVPVMPMSPSARLRIDYSKAVKISEGETTASDKAPEATTVLVTEPTAAVADTTTVTTQPTLAETTVPTVQSTYEETTVYVNETAKEEADSKGIPSFVFILLVIGAAVMLTLLLIYDDSKEKIKNDDK
ncbi:MAG: NEAT domain-containing protein [Clostridia bacterium]|nr:NEAT domain-containing protein [Clostridia bacterium]